MAYKVWTANADRHNDWTTELILKDGTRLKMGEPVDLSADQVKTLEGDGRVINDSSAEEAKKYHEAREGFIQMPGTDIAGSAPVFANAGVSNQANDPAVQAEVDQPQSQQGSGSSSGQRSGSSNDNK